jgi:hypothetical protein
VNVHDDLKQGARGGSGTGQRRVRAVLVAGEIALSLVLLVGAGLTIRSFIKLQREPAGFNPDGVLTLGVNLPAARYPTPAQKAEFWQRALEELRRIPEVEIAAATSRLPLLPGNSTRGLTIAHLPPNSQASAHYRTATPRYFQAMGIPLLSGRAFDERIARRPLVAIISAMAAPLAQPESHRRALFDQPTRDHDRRRRRRHPCGGSRPAAATHGLRAVPPGSVAVDGVHAPHRGRPGGAHHRRP